MSIADRPVRWHADTVRHGPGLARHAGCHARARLARCLCRAWAARRAYGDRPSTLSRPGRLRPVAPFVNQPTAQAPTLARTRGRGLGVSVSDRRTLAADPSSLPSGGRRLLPPSLPSGRRHLEP
jgi:hypothetical protein